MNNRDVKLDLIQALKNRGVFFKQVDQVEYRTRCPYCGDSSKENTGHFYMRINPDDNFPIVYHCFLCEEKGILKSESLSLLGIHDTSIKSSLFTMNKTSDKIDNKNLLTETKNISFDYHLPEITCGKKTQYIEDRLGLKFNKSDFEKMKVITSFRQFLIENHITKLLCSDEIAYRIEDHFVGFLTNGNSHILFRDITEKDNFRWVKYPITEKSKQNRIFYSMATEIDIFTKDELTINLAEGVMDTLSVCYNLGFSSSNCMNISVSGKYYERLLLYLLDLGLVGSNITINIFSDNDKMFNKKNKDNKNNNTNTDLNYYKKILKNYQYLYKEINVFYNTISKDVGVPRNKISLKKYKL